MARRVKGTDSPGGTAAAGDVASRAEADTHPGQEPSFRALAENTPLAIARLDLRLRHVYVNPAAERALGLRAAQVLGRSFSELGVRGELVTLWESHLRQVLETGVSRTLPYEVEHPDGRAYLEMRLVPERNAAGTVESVLAITQDVSRHKRLEQELRESTLQVRTQAAELSAVLDAVPALVFITHEVDARVVTGNRHCCEQLGLPPGQPVHLARGPDGAAPGMRLLRQGVELPPDQMPLLRAARHGQEVRHVEAELHLPDGQVRHVLGNASPLLNDAGEPRGAVAALVDITERRRAEDAQLRLLEMVHALAEAQTPAELAPVVVRQMRRALLAPLGALWCPTPERTHLERVALLGAGSQAGAGTLPVDAPLPVAEAFRTGEERVFECREDWTAGWPGLLGATALPELGGLACWPLVVRGQVLAVLELGFRGTRRFPPEDFQLGRALTQQAALALERTQLFQAERAAREEAQEANRAKDQFLALVSHELRNPLAAISAAAEVLLLSVSAEDRLRHAAEIIRRNARQQSRLVDDLLDLAQLRHQPAPLRRRTVSLQDLADTGMQAHREEAALAGLALESSVAPGLCLDGDVDRLQQVLDALLRHALRSTAPGGRVRVTATRRGSLARLEVASSDASGSRMGLPGGTHLDVELSLAKALVELHGGRLDASAPGGALVVELPVLDAPPPARPARSARVLVVEDHADTRSVLAQSLRLHGYQVDEAGTAAAAMEVAQAQHPDAVLVDIRLPDGDGHELWQRLRALPGLERVPAFVVSAASYPADQLRAREAGFSGHFAKPVDLHTLRLRLAHCLEPAEAPNPHAQERFSATQTPSLIRAVK